MSYVKLNTLSKIDVLLQHLIKVSNGWFISNGFKILKVPRTIINKDLMLKNLTEKFNGDPIIFYMKPNTFYRFHTDQTRRCAINMLISGFDSHCYFANVTEYEELFENVNELIYENYTYYLLNTKNKHAVLNLNNERYMLSLGFNDYDYDEIKKYCINYRL